jgi:hypothetical protein
MIWEYAATVSAPNEDDLATDMCIFCRSFMRILMQSLGPQYGGTKVKFCPDCGWWTYWQQTRSIDFDPD